jgi:hypothetical protein
LRVPALSDAQLVQAMFATSIESIWQPICTL